MGILNRKSETVDIRQQGIEAEKALYGDKRVDTSRYVPSEKEVELYKQIGKLTGFSNIFTLGSIWSGQRFEHRLKLSDNKDLTEVELSATNIVYGVIGYIHNRITYGSETNTRFGIRHDIIQGNRGEALTLAARAINHLAEDKIIAHARDSRVVDSSEIILDWEGLYQQIHAGADERT